MRKILTVIFLFITSVAFGQLNYDYYEIANISTGANGTADKIGDEKDQLSVNGNIDGEIGLWYPQYGSERNYWIIYPDYSLPRDAYIITAHFVFAPNTVNWDQAQINGTDEWEAANDMFALRGLDINNHQWSTYFTNKQAYDQFAIDQDLLLEFTAAHNEWWMIGGTKQCAWKFNVLNYVKHHHRYDTLHVGGFIMNSAVNIFGSYSGNPDGVECEINHFLTRVSYYTDYGGDINFDGTCDIDDLGVLLANWTGTGNNQFKMRWEGDMDDDGDVDSADQTILIGLMD